MTHTRVVHVRKRCGSKQNVTKTHCGKGRTHANNEGFERPATQASKRVKHETWVKRHASHTLASHVTRHIRHTSHIPNHTSHIPHPPSHVTRHTSHVTHPPSPIPHHTSHLVTSRTRLCRRTAVDHCTREQTPPAWGLGVGGWGLGVGVAAESS